MASEDRPSPYFGDYPDGAYWSAIGPEGAEERQLIDEERFSYRGTELRIMWDEQAGPLWGDEGLLDDSDEWMRRALGLSDALIADLSRWMRDMSALHDGPFSGDWRDQTRRLDSRGERLAERLQGEVGARYRVRYHA